MVAKKKKTAPPAGQAARTAAMRARLIAATKQSLLEMGYGRTTAVEVCARAGVTRGALFHHFAGLPELFAATLEAYYVEMMTLSNDGARQSNNALCDYIDVCWARFGRADFKIVIEAWLAARNDTDLRKEIEPVIRRFWRLAAPELNPVLGERVGRSADQVAFYRLILESMIGMALGRAVTPEGSLGHEDKVVGLLKEIARARTRSGSRRAAIRRGHA